MPLYDYQCRTCRHVTEVRHGFGETYDGVCPSCGGAVSRVFNPAGIVFKGSGFYVTDSRKGSGDAAGASGGSSDGKADAPKSDAPKSDAPKSDAPKSDGPKGDTKKSGPAAA